MSLKDNNSLVLVDSHVHLGEEKYRDELPAVLEEAKREHVACMVVPATDTASWPRVLQLSRQYAQLVPALGLQPHDAKEFTPAHIENLAEYCGQLAAIGEIGLDFHYDLSPRPLQIECFRCHLQLAKEKKLPVILHCRDAEQEFLQSLKDIGVPQSGVVHCCTCAWEYVETFLEMGLYIGVTGMVTFPKLHTVHTIAKRCPLNRLLVETDGPYLAPVPHRGQLNRPAYVRYTAQTISYLRQTEPEEIYQTTSANAVRLFGPRISQAINS